MRREYNNSLLPEGYTKLDYIESTGMQYIELTTNCDKNLYTGITCDVLNYTGFYFVDNTNRSNFVRDYYSASTDATSVGAKSSVGGVGGGMSSLIGQRHIFTLSTIGKEVNGNFTSLVRPITYNITSLTIFRCKTWDNKYYYSSSKLYDCRLENGNTEVNHLIPALRNFDSKPGLYDLCGSICPLTGTPFYINAGTDEFLYD